MGNKITRKITSFKSNTYITPFILGQKNRNLTSTLDGGATISTPPEIRRLLDPLCNIPLCILL